MAPVVHGLEKEFAGRVDFLYLNIADPMNREAMRRYGFVSTPHIFLLRADGTPIGSTQGVVPRDSLQRSLGRLVKAPPR